MDNDGDFYVGVPMMPLPGDINVINGEDCDDNNVSSYPNAELCDGLDNACAGQFADEADDDGDGYIDAPGGLGKAI